MNQGDAVATCRLMLSQPRAFIVQARARLANGGAPAARMEIAVNGAPCRGAWHSSRAAAWGECRITFPATTSTIIARVEGQDVHTGDVKVKLIPNGRLAALPREAGDLYPKGERDGFWSNFWPFPR